MTTNNNQFIFKTTAVYAEVAIDDDDTTPSASLLRHQRSTATATVTDTATTAATTATAVPMTTATTATSKATGRFTVRDEFRHIPEARTLTWTDDFFHRHPDSGGGDDDSDIVAVFDMDYDNMEQFYTTTAFLSYACLAIYPPLFALATAALVPCFLRNNVQWSVRANHVAITRDGIRFVLDRRPFGWGLACMDSGKKSKTIPFDKITDCDIEEPAGNACCCVPRVLFSVRIDTASSNRERPELVLAGLKDPFSFKKLVWAMKRAQQQQRNNNNHDPAIGSLQLFHSYDTNQPPAPMAMMRAMPAVMNAQNTGDAGSGSDDIATLLREIRDELRQNNQTLQELKNTTHVVPPAPDNDNPGLV